MCCARISNDYWAWRVATLLVLFVLLLLCPLPSDPSSCTVLFSPSLIVFTFFLFLPVLIFCRPCPSCVSGRFWVFRPPANSAISLSSPCLPGSFCLMLPRWPLAHALLLSIFLPSSCLIGCLYHLTSVDRLALPVLLTLLAICAPFCQSWMSCVKRISCLPHPSLSLCRHCPRCGPGNVYSASTPFQARSASSSLPFALVSNMCVTTLLSKTVRFNFVLWHQC